jgi:membrane-bound ClpP family serine protease
VSPTSIVLLSLLIALVVLIGITAFVSNRVHRSNVSAATQVAESFVVRSRGWQATLLRWTGIFFIAVGCVLLLVAIVFPSQEGAGIPGVIIAIGGLVFLWISRGVRRARLEVTDDSISVFRWTGAPRRVLVNEISRLTPMASNNYGGVVARSDHGRLFSANRLMLGYPQLIDYLHTRRPDLAIPADSAPL